MKRILSFLLALTLLFALTACGSKAENDTSTQEPGVVAPEDSTDTPAEDGTSAETNDANGDTGTGTAAGGNSTSGQKPGGGTSSGGTVSGNGGAAAQKPSTGGSGSSGTASSSDKGDLTTLMGKLIQGTTGDMKVETKEISPDAFPSNLFIDYLEGAKAVSSNALISSVAHSVCLLKVPDGTDAAKVAEQINQKKDPRKWVCVEAEKAVVLQKGSYILLAMSTTDIVDTVSKNFKAMF